MDFRTDDVAYQHQDGQPLLARLYQPIGPGPFPAVLEVHGGAWTGGDRFNNVAIAEALAADGVVVLSIDFRMPPVAPYPGLLQDVNLGVRFLKANAKNFRSRPEWVGSWGTSSGGHVVLLAGMRPHDARYAALPGPTGVDATQAWVISGWGVLCPLLRYDLAKQANNAGVVANHDAFWVTEDAMREGSPPLMLERGEKVALPPALVFGGDADEWVPVDLMRKFVADYAKAGGKSELVLYPKANHQFMTGKPDAPFAKPALDAMKAFIRKHTA
jgi:acetyl esterase